MNAVAAPKSWISPFDGYWQKKIGTHFHHKLILYSSCHVPRVLVVATRGQQGTIRVGNKRLLVLTGALIAMTVTQRATSCHHWWYLFLLHWIFQSSIHLVCPWFFNTNPYLHIILLVITNVLIASTVTQRAMSCHHRWYMCFLHWMIQSLIQLICHRFFNSHPTLHISQHTICKLLQYLVGLHLIRQIPCHRSPPIMYVTIFMYVWLMYLSWDRYNYNNMP